MTWVTEVPGEGTLEVSGHGDWSVLRKSSVSVPLAEGSQDRKRQQGKKSC